jgi:hypothetical protein
VIEQVTVEEPIAELVGIEFDDRGGHGGYIYSVLKRGVIALAR